VKSFVSIRGVRDVRHVVHIYIYIYIYIRSLHCRVIRLVCAHFIGPMHVSCGFYTTLGHKKNRKSSFRGMMEWSDRSVRLNTSDSMEERRVVQSSDDSRC